ncbi:hypothetical protein FNV43_RR11381 [Rhamnella rubrinervis]|uniref:Formin-like protein n=1 Tax=Rhamnella rubrinervis TaxID=2594499 RepID=A0A8K0H5K8_9ROSA|nr:hypothetical protein FNV43_RR11381 [Rhamnella rubrinervis]
MALFRKFFYRKPPDGLLEISERVYVFDCCFTTDVWEEDEYKVYIGGIVGQLREHFPDASFMVFNFREGENQSQISSILSDYDMTVMDYPRNYEGCPLLTMEMIHHFLRSSESWLSLGQQNVLMMHCERGGWPVLAFMLAALLIYRKHFTGEQKTLDMIYKQAPRELLQLMSPLNPIPSQLRYLQYVSRRNVRSEWPPLDRALTLDCVILRLIPNLDGEGGCRPIFRIYGQDPFMAADRTPKVLFSTPKRSKLVRHYNQADCELVKIDIHCHTQGDVVLECITLDNDLEREQMMFRVMFNTAFIRSNILMLNRDEIDILWNVKDQFPKDFRAEVLFSEMDAGTSIISIDLPGIEEKEGLPVEAFARVQEIFSNVDWLDPKTDVALNVLQQISASNVLQGKLDSGSPIITETSSLFLDSTPKRKLEPKVSRNDIKSSKSMGQGEWLEPKTDVALNVLQQNTGSNVLQGKLDGASGKTAETGSLFLESTPKMKSDAKESGNNIMSPKSTGQGELSTPSFEASIDLNAIRKKIEPHEQQDASSIRMKIEPQERQDTNYSSGKKTELQELQEKNSIGKKTDSHVMQDTKPIQKKIEPQDLQIALQRSAQSKIISQRVPKTSLSAPVSYSNSLQGSPVSISRYHSAPSALGITALLHDHAASNREEELRHPVIVSSPCHTISVSDSTGPKSVQFGNMGMPVPPPPLPSSTDAPTVGKTYASYPPPPLPPSPSQPLAKAVHHPETSLQVRFQSASIPPPPPPPLLSGALVSSAIKGSSLIPSPPPLPPSYSEASPSSSVKNIISFPSPSLPPPPPPPPPPPSSLPQTSSSSTIRNSISAPPPPPPPPFSGTPSSAIAKTSFSIPPPLHPLVFLNFQGNIINTTTPPPPKSANGPPVPPPAPLINGVLKAGSANHSGISNGNVPSIPGPPSAPLGAKGRGLSRSGPRNQVQSKKSNLKPYHWLKLTRAMQGSLWAEAQKTDEASKAPEFDMSELESLFSTAAPNSELGSTGGKSKGRASGPKPEKVQLIELRRAYNCEIMLSKVKMPLPDLMNSALALDDSALDVDQVENLIKFCPTKEEMELLKSYSGDKDNLGKCEHFFLELMKVPRVESKLRVFSFKIQFRTQVSDLRKNLNIVNSVADEIRNSVKLKRIMQTILSLGNALNHGTARGSAIGFRLDSLLKLTDTRARNNKMTLMHYLCKVLAEKLPDLLDFPKDLVSLEASTKIQLKYLAEEMQAISKGLEKVVQELTASENDGPVSENFCKILKEFLTHSEAEVRSLASLYSNVGRNADALALYFGEDPARCPFEQVVSTLLNFVRMFVRAHEENCKHIEFERKKAQKEAENEKTKLAAHKKEPQLLVQTPVKSGNIK